MSTEYLDHITEIKNFGIYCVPIDELATLLAAELFYSDEITIAGFDPEIENDINSPDFQKALSPHTNNFVSALIACIERQEIKAEWLVRNIKTGEIDPQNTLIEIDEVYKFLSIFGLHDIAVEDNFPFRDMLEHEGDIFYGATEYVRIARLYHGKVDRNFIEQEKSKLSEHPELLEAILIENFSLKREAQSRARTDTPQEKPLATRERNTLLLIIAALAQDAKIDLSKPAKAGETIAHLTELLGAPVDHSTIEQKVKQIADALKSRAK